MPFAIPSFAWSHFPTNSELDQCRMAGLIQPSVTTFAGEQDYKDRQPANPLPPKEGSPKWWVDMSRNTALGYFYLTGEQHRAAEMSQEENAAYSAWARAFYAERPNLMVPTMKSVAVNPQEWRRLSFSDSFDAPAEYPLGLIWDWSWNNLIHSFPTDIVLFMYNDVPCFDRISKALELFKLTPQMPTGPGAATPTVGGYSATQLVTAVKKALLANTHAAVVAAVKAGGTDAQIADKVVKL